MADIKVEIIADSSGICLYRSIKAGICGPIVATPWPKLSEKVSAQDAVVNMLQTYGYVQTSTWQVGHNYSGGDVPISISA